MIDYIKYWTLLATFHVRWFIATTKFAVRQAITRTSEANVGKFAPKRGQAILIVEVSIPKPDTNAGDRNIVEFVRTLIADYRHVIFWPLHESADSKYVDDLILTGAQVLTGSDRPSIGQWLGRYESMLDSVLLCRPYVAARWLPQSTNSALCKTTYYGHDLHFARLEKQAELSKSPRIRAEAAHIKAVEASIWKKVPRSLYPTIEEVDAVQTLQPEADVRHVQIFCFDEFRVPERRPSEKHILFVAGFGHPPNIDAAIWLAQKIFPIVLERHPEASLSLVGSSPPPEVCALASGRIKVTGWVSAESLNDLYLSARAAVVPLRFGAGLKLKVVEALANGIPLVTTSTGAQGLDGLRDVSLVADSDRGLADFLAEVLSLTEAGWLKQAQQQVDYVEQRFSRSGMRSSLLAALGPLAPRPAPEPLATGESSLTDVSR